MEKVFAIGFHKTATSSLETALEVLGYQVFGAATEIPDRATAKEVAQEVLRDYDALQDFPWPVLYKWLDRKYPESKFILTVRSEDEWIESVRKNFGGKKIKTHEWIYGAGDPIGNEKTYLHKYKKHNEEVIKYFGDRRGKDLLVINITNGEGWEKLCPFLDLKEPWIPFPKKKVSKEKKREMSVVDRGKIKIENILQLFVKHHKQGILAKKIKERCKRYVGKKFKF